MGLALKEAPSIKHICISEHILDSVYNAICVVRESLVAGMYLKIEDDVVKDVKFETFGCGSAIASSSMATELIKGKPLSEVKELTNKAVAEALDGLPDYKMHCSVLAEEAIQSALEDYYKNNPTKEE